LSGPGQLVTAVDSPNRTFSYTIRVHRNSQSKALTTGTVINRTNEVFNGVYIIDIVSENTIGYPRAAANVVESAANGTVTNLTNINYFNGTYPVARVNSPTSISYNRVAPELAANLTNLVTNPGMHTTGSTYAIRTNLCPNPTFTTDLAGWSVGTGITATRDTTDGIVGGSTTSASIKKNALTGTNAAFTFALTGLTVGTIYTLSGYFKNVTGDAQASLVVVGLTGTEPTVPTSSWVRREITFTANAANMSFGVDAGTATLVDSQFKVDGLMLERSNFALPYFDGASPAAGDFTYSWSGTANNSISYQNATNVVGVASQSTTGTKAYSTTAWSSSGTRSLAMVTKNTTTDQWVDISNIATLAANKTYTFVATVKTTTTVGNPSQVRLAVQTGGSVQTVNGNINGGSGVYRIAGTFSTAGRNSGDYIRLYYATSNPEQIIYWDDLLIFEGADTSVPWFHGSSTGTSITTYAWTGTPNASTSTRITNIPNVYANILSPYGHIARTNSPAHVEILYRSGWLG